MIEHRVEQSGGMQLDLAYEVDGPTRRLLAIDVQTAAYTLVLHVHDLLRQTIDTYRVPPHCRQYLRMSVRLSPETFQVPQRGKPGANGRWVGLGIGVAMLAKGVR